MVRATSARPSGGRPEGAAKMTSSIFPPRSDFAPCSPMTQARASTTLDLPEPFGPTTAVMPGSKRRVVDDANDLNPLRVRLFRCMRRPLVPMSHGEHCVEEGRVGGYLPDRCEGGNPPGPRPVTKG